MHCCYIVDSLFGLWNSSMEGFSDIGARQYFENADFFMPDLYLKRTMLAVSPVSPLVVYNLFIFSIITLTEQIVWNCSTLIFVPSPWIG